MTGKQQTKTGDPKPRPMDALPNQDGFLFEAILADGTTAKCKVIRRRDGQHRVRGVRYGTIVSWRPR